MKPCTIYILWTTKPFRNSWVIAIDVFVCFCVFAYFSFANFYFSPHLLVPHCSNMCAQSSALFPFDYDLSVRVSLNKFKECVLITPTPSQQFDSSAISLLLANEKQRPLASHIVRWRWFLLCTSLVGNSSRHLGCVASCFSFNTSNSKVVWIVCSDNVQFFFCYSHICWTFYIFIPKLMPFN